MFFISVIYCFIFVFGLFFFFFKQKTAYEMRISDWSSDVCSSGLRPSPISSSRGRRGCGCGWHAPWPVILSLCSCFSLTWLWRAGSAQMLAEEIHRVLVGEIGGCLVVMLAADAGEGMVIADIIVARDQRDGLQCLGDLGLRFLRRELVLGGAMQHQIGRAHV